MPPALPDLQRAFRAATYDGDTAMLQAWVAGDARSVAAHLGLYRNNTLVNLRNALQADYPVVERLVSAEFFEHAARAYIASTPSTSGDINDYGADFPEFLEAFPAAAGLPYLGGVARLERAWKQSFCAGDAEAEDMSGMVTLAPQHLAELHFRLHPSLRLIWSPYPVLRIWQVNQSDDDHAHIDLDAGTVWIAVLRAHDRVGMTALEAGEYAWLDALHAGSNLGAAVEAAFSVDQHFELEPCLRRHLAAGTVVGYSLGEKT